MRRLFYRICRVRKLLGIYIICFVLFLPFNFPLSHLDIRIPPLSSSLHVELAVLIIFFQVYLLKRLISNKDIHFPLAIYFLAIYFLYDVYISFKGLYTIHSLKHSLKFFSFSVFILIFQFIISRDFVSKIIKVIGISSVAVSILGIMQFISPYLVAPLQRFLNVVYLDPLRIRGPFEWHTTYALYLCVGLPFVLYSFLKASKLLSKLLYGLYASLIFLGILLSNSLGALATLFLTGLCALFLKIFIRFNIRFRYFSIFFLCFLVLVPSLFWLKLPLVRKVFYIEDSEKSRILTWKISLDFIRERPLWGWGPDTSHLKFLSLRRYRRPPQHSHNIFLETGINEGLLGLTFFIFLIILVLRETWKWIHKDLGLGLLFFLGLCTFLIFLQFDVILYYDDRLLALFWTVISLPFFRKDALFTNS